MGIPGGWELIVIVLVIVLLFGSRKIPELMKGLGSGIREFKKASSGESDTNDNDKNSKKSNDSNNN
jgi:sec-independent protein translocase protein TatA